MRDGCIVDDCVSSSQSERYNGAPRQSEKRRPGTSTVHESFVYAGRLYGSAHISPESACFFKSFYKRKQIE